MCTSGDYIGRLVTIVEFTLESVKGNTHFLLLFVIILLILSHDVEFIEKQRVFFHFFGDFLFFAFEALHIA